MSILIHVRNAFNEIDLQRIVDEAIFHAPVIARKLISLEVDMACGLYASHTVCTMGQRRWPDDAPGGNDVDVEKPWSLCAQYLLLATTACVVIDNR